MIGFTHVMGAERSLLQLDHAALAGLLLGLGIGAMAISNQIPPELFYTLLLMGSGGTYIVVNDLYHLGLEEESDQVKE